MISAKIQVEEETVTHVKLFQAMTLAVATYFPRALPENAPGTVYIFSATKLGMASGHDAVLKSKAEIVSMLRLPSGAILLAGSVFEANRETGGTIEVFSPEQLQTGGSAKFSIMMNESVTEIRLAGAYTLAASTAMDGKILFFKLATLELNVGSVPAFAELDLREPIHAFVPYLHQDLFGS